MQKIATPRYLFNQKDEYGNYNFLQSFGQDRGVWEFPVGFAHKYAWQ